MPLVSIVTPTFNCSKFIDETIKSVLSQDFLDWELILVDDCSTDDTLFKLNQYSVIDDRILVVGLNENHGAAYARNVAIKMARGRFICFLDSDDLWISNKLSTQVKYMLDENIPFSCSAYYKINEDGELIGKIKIPNILSYKSVLKRCDIGCLTAMYDSALLGKLLMPEIRKRQDVGLWLKILKKTPFCYAIQTPLAMYRIRAGSLSSNKFFAARNTWRLYRDVEGLPFVKAVYYFSCYAINGVLRTKIPVVGKLFGLLE